MNVPISRSVRYPGIFVPITPTPYPRPRPVPGPRPFPRSVEIAL